MNLLFDSIYDGFLDTIKMLPLLIIVFFIIDYFEFKFGDKFNKNLKKAGKFGPIIGAILGIIPQCGISVLAVTSYSQGLITLGTMMAVFISTSDEALPVLMSTPSAANVVIPFILTKLILAIVLGYIIDFIFKKGNLKLNPINKEPEVYCCELHNLNHVHKENHNHEHGRNLKEIFIFTLKKSLKISIYIFIITAAMNFILLQSNIVHIFNKGTSFSLIQIAISSIVGLIPNCATSVALIEVYLKNGITFAALIAGLVSNAGLALIVLFKEVKEKKKAIYITLVLCTCGFISGIILSLLKIML